MRIADGQFAVGLAEKRLAYSAWFIEQCMRYLFMHRLILLKIVADGKTSFNNSFKRLMTGLLYSEQMGDGFWEACKHMLYGDQIGGVAAPKGTQGQPWPNETVKVWAFAELDTYTPASKQKYEYDAWHDHLGSVIH